MDWVLRSPQIHSTFGNLRFLQADGYHVNENCNAALETILHNILTEDKYLRTYRRNISFGQNIQKDLIPLLIHAKEDKTIELLTQILVNLTIPIECLLSVDIISKTDFGRHTVFEINNLLATTKIAFTDYRATRVIIEFLKKNVNVDQKIKLNLEQCANISNSLLLLRNILHIPEENSGQSQNYNGPSHTVQNKILWNMFSQGADKVLIKLMIIPDATNWGVSMVQLIALLYKDQHVVTLHKLLNLWLESSLSESSDDNESNTTPPDRGSENSSPMLTSDPTSDSSDTGGSGKSNDEPNGNSVNDCWNSASVTNVNDSAYESFKSPKEKGIMAPTKNNSEASAKNITKTKENGERMVCDTTEQCTQSKKTDKDSSNNNNNKKKTVTSESSDCGYGTQIENQESISASSNEDEHPTKKPVHQKPHNSKQKNNNKGRYGITLQERRRKKIVKRGKTNKLNVQGLFHKTPTDDDITNILKEFTVDFILKGYDSLVQTLHTQILTNLQLEIDTSHFFWLVTYFLKFATQIELGLEHVCSVLSFDVVSYLIAEGVNLCEQFELAIKLDKNDLKPSTRRLHLVVTAIREFVQAIEVYKKFSHISKDDQDALVSLQIKMCETNELRSLLVLLLRHYNPKYHSKQYLQDLVVTNHILLTFLDNVMKLPEYKGSTNMVDHIKQFATTEVMYQYGLLLEDYSGNGVFVNDCIFTIMHHVGGELASLVTLFQPKILKTFTSIWKSEFEICDDWSDLIEYVINTFIKKPHTLQSTANFRLDTESFGEKAFVAPSAYTNTNETDNEKKLNGATINSSEVKWTDDELSSLSWNYMQCSALPDSIGELVKMFKEDGIIKTRESIVKQLFKQNLIRKGEFDKFTRGESERSTRNTQMNNEMRDEEMAKLCEQLTQDGKFKFLEWVQVVLLETCFAKILIDKTAQHCLQDNATRKEFILVTLKKNFSDRPIMSPVSYHSLLLNQSVPLVPWNCEQATICKDLKFLQLLDKLGFQMPVDSGKVFIRIPHFWSAEFLFEVAGKIFHVDQSKLKFSVNDLVENSAADSLPSNNFVLPKDLTKNVSLIETPDSVYQIHKQKQFATMVNFTPMPGSSFNSEPSYTTKRNWFELVQKSQEYKLTLKLKEGSAFIEDDYNSDVVMVPEGSPVATPALPFPPHPLMMPALPTVMTVKQETTETTFKTLIPHSEYYNNSVCETASVASDLTRMYVSDEDEKPEVLICPVLDVDPMIEESSDLEVSTPKKRPRMQFSQPL